MSPFQAHAQNVLYGNRIGSHTRSVLYIGHQPAQQWTIFCDSRSALQVVQTYLKPRACEQLVQQIVLLLAEAFHRGHIIKFQWIPSHCGIAGNERADAEARMAHSDGAFIEIAFSRSDIGALLAHLMQAAMQSHWHDPSHQQDRVCKLDAGSRLHFPSVVVRRHGTLLHRLRLGVAYTKHYLHKIGIESNPNCAQCNTPETIGHLLCACPKYTSERTTLEATVKNLDSRPLSEETLLGARTRRSDWWRVTKALLNFLCETGLDTRL